MGLTDFVKDGLNSVFSSIFSPRKQAPQKRKREEKQADAARGRGKPVPRRDAVVQADAAAQSSAQQLQEPVQARAPERGFEQPAATPVRPHLQPETAAKCSLAVLSIRMNPTLSA